MNQQIDTLAQKLASAAQGDVLKGNETQVYISLGQQQGVLPGNRFEIVRLGEPLKIGDEIIGYEETRVAEVEVERARDRVSICKVMQKSDVPQEGDKAYQMRKKINTLVVSQFSYNQGFNRLTKSLQEKLVTAMANRGMKVVERDQLERVLREQKLGYSGLVNMSSAQKIGELLGAEGMLLGTVSDMGDAIAINARLVNIESGNAVSASEVDLPKTPLIAQLLDRPVEDSRIVSQNDTPSHSKKRANTQQQFFENDIFRIEVISFKKEGGSIELKLKYLNRTKKVIAMGLAHPRKNTYLVDNLGNQYPFKESEINSRTREFPAGVPRISIITFSDVKGGGKNFIATAKYFTSGSNKQFFVNFKKLNLM